MGVGSRERQSNTAELAVDLLIFDRLRMGSKILPEGDMVTPLLERH